jgi:hypothetical protein
MSLATIYADIKEVAAELGPIISAIGGKSASTAPSSAPSVSVGLDVLPTATAALNTILAVTNAFAAYQADLQTPAMVNASVAEKLQAFKDRVNQDLATGDEADLERLEAQ